MGVVQKAVESFLSLLEVSHGVVGASRKRGENLGSAFENDSGAVVEATSKNAVKARKERAEKPGMRVGLDLKKHKVGQRESRLGSAESRRPVQRCPHLDRERRDTFE